MNHMFDIEDAKKYGILAAVILQNIKFWQAQSKANNANFHDGLYWTYNSVRAWTVLFPYATTDQIRRAIDKLKETGAIVTGNFNKSSYDRTLWYSAQEDLLENPNEVVGNHEPIPDVNTDNKPDKSRVRQKSKMTLSVYLSQLKDADQKFMTIEDPVYQWATELGLPEHWVEYAWKRFKEAYVNNPNYAQTTYKDWRAHFRNAVKQNWYKLWFIKDDKFFLTQNGQMVEKEMA